MRDDDVGLTVIGGRALTGVGRRLARLRIILVLRRTRIEGFTGRLATRGRWRRERLEHLHILNPVAALEYDRASVDNLHRPVLETVARAKTQRLAGRRIAQERRL